ncbi:MAG: gliding motility-associated C-terminal domain-containing protein [Ginsengibacter sp.]
MKQANKFLLVLLLISSKTLSQNCPPNIGFENGTFDNWACSAGHILESDGSLTLFPSLPIPGRHTIIANTIPQELDPYGGFPVNCPNGSGYSIKLGNSTPGNEAEGVSYTFVIPSNQNDYSIIYNYAVVFQNPNHLPYQQPRFTSRVYNITDNRYIECGSFEFVASSNLPGFQLAAENVYYKPWSPVTVNLSGLAGKMVRLEFTTNDCAFKRHFGYAYLDVDESCTASAINGNTYCGGGQSLTLTGPYGFQSYHWYTADFSKLLGTGSQLTFTSPPPPNTKYALEIIPYDGLGCQDTLYTTIHYSGQPFVLNVVDSLAGCSPGVDLTSPSLTAGSSPGLNFSYYLDPGLINYLAIPKQVPTDGTYYIKAVNSVGCNDVKPIHVIVRKSPNIAITQPAGVCIPQTIDLTLQEIVAESDPGLSYSYWENTGATTILPNPGKVAVSGTYYIKGVSNSNGCSATAPVNVKIGPVPDVIIHDPTSCGMADLTAAGISSGSTTGLTYTYWMDAAASVSLLRPDAIFTDGTYYIKASSDLGCSVVEPVVVIIKPIPVFTVTTPPVVSYPVLTVDITNTVVPVAGLLLSFWNDSLGIKTLPDPALIDKSGVYYIKATNSFFCTLVKPVTVKIIPSPDPIIYVPTAFTPNRDGLNDIFKIKVLGEISLESFKVYDRLGRMLFNSSDPGTGWDGSFKGIEQPTAVYVWVLDGYDEYYKRNFIKKGMITLIR